MLFACNNAYCINEKKAIKLLETFEHKPEKYTEKVNHIFEVLGISLFECYDMTEKLYNEVNEIVSEINNFLNEESSDERKQINLGTKTIHPVKYNILFSPNQA